MSTGSAPFAPTYEEVIWERTTESRISTVISLLPMSLQSRMSPFKSRRTASLGSLTTDGRLVCTSSSTPSLPSEKPRSGWGLTMRRSSGMVSRDGSTTPSSCDGEEAFSSGAVTPMREIALRPGSEPKDAGAGSPSGIRWKVANQGRIPTPPVTRKVDFLKAYTVPLCFQVQTSSAWRLRLARRDRRRISRGGPLWMGSPTS